MLMTFSKQVYIARNGLVYEKSPFVPGMIREHIPHQFPEYLSQTSM
jgi:hypothetical protein